MTAKVATPITATDKRMNSDQMKAIVLCTGYGRGPNQNVPFWRAPFGGLAVLAGMAILREVTREDQER